MEGKSFLSTETFSYESFYEQWWESVALRL